MQLITTQHQPVPSLENLKRYGQKAPPVEVPAEPKIDQNALVCSMLPQKIMAPSFLTVFDPSQIERAMSFL